MSDTFVCVRVYPSGDIRYTIRDEAGMKNWLDYNKVYRPGNTLFINGQPVEDTGSLSATRMNYLCSELPTMIFDDMSVNQGRSFIRNKEPHTQYGDDRYAARINFPEF